MRKLATICLLLVIAWPACAVSDGQVMYAGGTIAGLKDGSIGTLDTASVASLKFTSGASTLEIPFAKIVSYSYSQEVTRHLGVLPAIAVALVKKRQHSHFFRITFRDDSNTAQVAVFEVPKQMPRTLLAVLQARVPKASKPGTSRNCGAASSRR